MNKEATQEKKSSNATQIILKKWNHIIIACLVIYGLTNILQSTLAIECTITESNKADFIEDSNSYIEECDTIEFENIEEIALTKTIYIYNSVTLKTVGERTLFKCPSSYSYTIYIADAGKVVLKDLELKECGSKTYGSIIYVSNTDLDLESCNLSDNISSYGGAIYCYNSDIDMTNNAVSDNEASYHGAVFYATSCNIYSIDSSFVRNEAQKGSICYLSGCDNSVTFVTNSYNDNKGEDTSQFIYETTPGCNDIDITI